jgi:ABC-type sulfate transport system substrate-binding protein
VHPTHGGQVDHEAAVADGVAGDVVAAAADGDLEAALAAEAHGRLHVGRAVASGHQGRPPIDQPVVNAMR